MSDETKIAELERLMAAAWPAPWVAHTFEIDCPCPNGEHCGDTHSCEQVEAPEAYPASPEEPAAPGEGQCVVQISVPGLESLAGPTAAFIVAARNTLPSLLTERARILSAGSALARAMESIIANDKTTYQHHEARRSDGLTPREAEGGTIFLTPKEIARAALTAWEEATKPAPENLTTKTKGDDK
jgi:hypothetical protein